MRQLESSTLSNDIIALLVHTYTADAAREIFIRLFSDQVAGNDDYVAYVTIQLAGAGSAYRVIPITTAAAAAGVTAICLSTIPFPVSDTDVVKVYLTGAAGDTTTPDIITEIWDNTSELAVWDEVLTGATHNVPTSAGRRVRELGAASIVTGTATAGTAQTITLDADASATANIYNENLITIVEGTGAGQTRLIVEYTAGRVATVDRTWDVTPSTDSVYQVLAFSGILLADNGVAQAGAASTITLATTALTVADSYVGCAIYITGGTGSGQTRLITAYTTGRVATVSPAWDTQPDNTSVYKVLPVGRSIVETVGTTGYASIRASIGMASANMDTQLAALASDLPGRPTKGVEITFPFPMIDSSDHVSGKTGLTVTATISKDGAAFAACTNAVSEVSGGWYTIVLTADEMNADNVALNFAATGADTRRLTILTEPT